MIKKLAIFIIFIFVLTILFSLNVLATSNNIQNRKAVIEVKLDDNKIIMELRKILTKIKI